MSSVYALLRGFDLGVLCYVVLVSLVQLLLMGAGAWALRRHRLHTRHRRLSRMGSNPALPSISIIAPAYNEEATIVASVTSLLTLNYPQLEVVVVDDGSTDATLQVLRTQMDLHISERHSRTLLPTAEILRTWRSSSRPNLVVVEKRNGGKADALNAGMCVATGELACSIDADTLVEPDALIRMIHPFLADEDTVAVGATIRVANGSVTSQGRISEIHTPRRWLAGVQAVEYLRAFLFGRLGWNLLGGNLIISGAFGMFCREDLIAVGGYLHGSVGEDMELIARLREGGRHDLPAKVTFVPDPVAWTEVPESLRVLGRQRDRWHRGLAQTLWTHRRNILNPRRGVLGMVVYPYFVIIELLAPVVELAGICGVALGVALGAVNVSFALAFLALSYAFALLLSLAGVLLDAVASLRPPPRRETLWLVLWALLEPLGYRQCTLWWRLRGIRRALRGSQDWGVMTRQGFHTDVVDAVASPRPEPALAR